jgi:hypothetical protein
MIAKLPVLDEMRLNKSAIGRLCCKSRRHLVRSPKVGHETENEEAVCYILQEQFAAGGSYYPPEHVAWKYLAENLFVVGGAFVFTFALVMVIPAVGRRYWVWLRK